MNEERATETYDLVGGDLNLTFGEQTRITAEFSQSKNQALPQYASADGGMSFQQINAPSSGDEAQAYRLEFATGGGPVKATGYFRHIDSGFSSSFATSTSETDQYGRLLRERTERLLEAVPEA